MNEDIALALVAVLALQLLILATIVVEQRRTKHMLEISLQRVNGMIATLEEYSRQRERSRQ